MRRVVYKNVEPQWSGLNFAIGFTINPGLGVLWGNSDIPSERPRVYTLVLSDGVHQEVSETEYHRYRIGDEYP